MHLVLAVPGLATLTPVADPPPRRRRRVCRVSRGSSRPLARRRATRTGSPPRSPRAMASRGRPIGRSLPSGLRRSASIPRDSYWLCADPVTLVAGRDDAHVGATIRDFTTAESDALIATLNAHFAGDGLRFVAPRPDAWFVRAPNVPAMSTRPLDIAQGRSLRTQLPAGADAKAWWRWQEEIQMLLFTHPVTAARERAGRRSANALWLSAGGTRPPRPGPAPSIATFAGDDIALALAAHVGMEARPLPAHLDAVLAQTERAQTVILAPAAPIDFEAIDRAFGDPCRRCARARRDRGRDRACRRRRRARSHGWRSGRPGAHASRGGSGNPTSLRCWPRPRARRRDGHRSAAGPAAPRSLSLPLESIRCWRACSPRAA